MIKKNLSEIETGMVLGEDIVDTYGYVLLERGTILNAAHLALFKEKGVTHVTISEEDTRKTQQFLKRELQEIERRVNKKFEPHKKNKMMLHIATLAKKYLQAHVKEKTA